MYVCVCRAVTEREIQEAIEGGARTVEAVTQACCAGDDCGSCHPYIEEMIEAYTDGRVHLPVVPGRAA